MELTWWWGGINHQELYWVRWHLIRNKVPVSLFPLGILFSSFTLTIVRIAFVFLLPECFQHSDSFPRKLNGEENQWCIEHYGKSWYRPSLYVSIFYFLIKLQPQNDTESNSEEARQPLPRKILNEIEHIKLQRLWNQESMRADYLASETLQLHCEMKMMIQEAEQKCTQSANDAY